MRFSIIVPVYKVEKYLERCVQSILHQSFSDYECILVDDGSPDNCPAMCDAFAQNDSRIQVIHQKNGGLSAARNSGLKQAKGEYILFLDSDDKLCEEALQRIDETIEKEDVAIFNVLHKYPNEEKVVQDYSEFVGQTNIKTICEMFAHKFVQLPWRAYQSAYKREFLEANGFFFDEKIIGAEDLDFFIRLSEKNPFTSISNVPIVNYTAYREDSIIHAPSYASVIGQLIVFSKCFKMADMFANTSLMQEYFANRFANIIVLIHKIVDPNQQKKCVQFVEENKAILSYTSKKGKYMVAKGVWSLFGFQKGNSILSLMKG